jgi:hypothetical protein
MYPLLEQRIARQFLRQWQLEASDDEATWPIHYSQVSEVLAHGHRTATFDCHTIYVSFRCTGCPSMLYPNMVAIV